MAHTTERPSFLDDPVALQIAWHRLVTVADEMQAVLRRTAFSTILGAANDLGCEIMDARGWSVAHATTSNPTFNVAIPQCAQRLLALFPPESLAPGDVLLTNDPWIVCGHLSDFAVVTPFFTAGRLVGFTGSIGHVADIGGLLNSQVARSIFEEGLFVPPVKLYEAGKRNETVVSIIRRNVRTPEMTMGDIIALVTANGVAARQTLALLDDYGLTSLEPLSDAIQTRAEAAMRQAIGEIPDGDYPFEITFDDLDGPLTIGVVVHVRGTELVVDYVRVPPEHPHGGINCTYSITLARANYGLNCLLSPHMAGNEGLFRPTRIQVPEGTLLNARYPATVNDRTKVCYYVDATIWGALAAAVPHKVPAKGGFFSVFRMLGTDDNGVGFGELVFHGGGMGAGWATDGVGGICFPNATSNVPNEIVETTTSVLTLEKELRTDSGGPGRTRGGCGLRVTIAPPENLSHPVTVSALCHNQVFPPFGLAGGHHGTATQVGLNGAVIPTHQVREQLGAVAFTDPSLRMEVETAGGGGFGDPTERDPARVLADVRNGLVSVVAAARDYGVEVDLGALRARRTSPPATRILPSGESR
ncbi:MAG: hydantoinase B/oxoprolinase family protein [Chloroflexi bacterium]|nr:hydantoinase B/oxoprolinase family protein [Chloroflexota bacterium]